MRCRMLSKREIALAEEERDLVRSADIPISPEESLAEAKRRIGREHYTIRRRPGITKHGRTFTMTLRRSIWLHKGFERLDALNQAAILWHELVHVHQRAAMGDERFELYYLSPHKRWALEVPAYRMTIRAAERMSDGNFDAKTYIDAKLASFRSRYQMTAIPFAQFVKETSRIWAMDSRPSSEGNTTSEG